MIVSSGPKKYSGTQLPDKVVTDDIETRGQLFRTDADDTACEVDDAKVGSDDGGPGGCDNVLIRFDGSGVEVTYRNLSD